MNPPLVRENRPYQPTGRRPIARLFRSTARGATGLCLRLNISPDSISYFSIVAAAAAALCFLKSREAPWLLLVAPLLCGLRLWCNMLDGMVALGSGRASRRGEIVNDLPDRFSDVIIFVGAAHSGWMQPLFGYWAALMSLGTAYVGTLGQAVGGRREFSGWMSKPWRMVVLGAGAWLTYIFTQMDNGRAFLGRLTILEWSCVIVIAGCLQTCVQRLVRIWRALPGEKP